MPNTEHVLIIKLGALGDIIMSAGAIADIRAHHPQAHISVLTGPPYKHIMQRNPHIDAVLIDPRKPRWRLDILFALRRHLQVQNFHMVYDLQDNARTALYCTWLSPKADWSGTQKQASHRHIAKQPKAMPVMQRLADQLGHAGVPIRQTRTPQLHWMQDDVSALLAAAHIRDGFVLLIPGSSPRHVQKRWPYFAELATQLQAQGIRAITAPGPDDMALCAQLPAQILLDKGRALSVFQLAGLARHAGYIVGNDTGPTHLLAHCSTSKNRRGLDDASGRKHTHGRKRGLALFGSHLAAHMTGIERVFDVLEAENLADLPLAAVLEKVMAALNATASGNASGIAGGTASGTASANANANKNADVNVDAKGVPDKTE